MLLQRVFAHPLPRDMRVEDVLALCADLGVLVIHRRNGIGLQFAGRCLNFHTPHSKGMDKGQVASVRNLLRDGGVTPDSCT